MQQWPYYKSLTDREVFWRRASAMYSAPSSPRSFKPSLYYGKDQACLPMSRSDSLKWLETLCIFEQFNKFVKFSFCYFTSVHPSRFNEMYFLVHSFNYFKHSPQFLHCVMFCDESIHNSSKSLITYWVLGQAMDIHDYDYDYATTTTRSP